MPGCVRGSNAAWSGGAASLPLPVLPTVPRNYDELLANELAYDLNTPVNMVTNTSIRVMLTPDDTYGRREAKES